MKVLFNDQGYGRMNNLLIHAMSSDKRDRQIKTVRRLENTFCDCLSQGREEINFMSRPEELTDPQKFNEIMERINTKLAISAIPLRERALMAQALLGDELDYDIVDDDSVYPLTVEWYRKTFPDERI